MNIKRPLMPGFLKRAEQKLLLHKPGIWSTRTHLVLYYGIITMLVLAAISALDTTDLRDDSPVEYWTMSVSLISLIGIVVWLIYLLRFNVFKKYGRLHPLHALTAFLLYFISAGVLVLFSYVPPAVESMRANAAYGDEEMVKDINTINIRLCQLEYNQLNMDWDCDTVVEVKDDSGEDGRLRYWTSDTLRIDANDPGKLVRYQRLDEMSFQERIEEADSTRKLNDSLYAVYTTHDYAFVDPYVRTIRRRFPLLTSFEIYNTVFKQPRAAIDTIAAEKELTALLHKYVYPPVTSEDEIEIGKNDDPIQIVHKKYRLYKADNSISRIVSKKYRWYGSDLSAYTRLFYYLTLAISLLVFIFRHTTVRTFFLSVLAGVLLFFFSVLTLKFTGARVDGVYLCLMMYILLFFVGSLSAWSIKKRRVITGIFINLFVFLVPLLPLLTVAWYCYRKEEQIRHSGKPGVIPSVEQFAFYAEAAGAALLLLLLATYISKVYRRWYSLPEE